MDNRKTPEFNPSLWQHPIIRFSAAIVSCGVVLSAWSISPVMREDPFIGFVAAVIVTARFFGFGPALLCTAASVIAIDYFIFVPRLSFALPANDYQRLGLFMVVSVLTAGLARQRRQAETRATDVQQRMAAIVESSNDAILSTTPDGIITTWNHGAAELYGYTSEEVIGKNVSLLATPERAAAARSNLDRIKRGELIEGFQAEHLRRDRSRVNVLVSVSPLRNRDGVIGSSIIARDITSQKRAEDALRKNEKLATAGRLAATIAHEINNPLEAITNLLYLARKDQSRREEYLLMTEKEVQRVAAIAQQTLGFVREGSSPTGLNVAEILDGVLQLYSNKLQSRRIQTKKEYDSQIEVQGFPGELRQLFSNLIINAADAMADGGTLQLRISRSPQRSNGHRDGIRVIIADNGSGIPPGVVANIFEPFFTTKKDLGTGLGLWLSQGIVEKHGGSIRVRSCVDPQRSGTVFSVFLPAAFRETPSAKAAVSA